MHGFVKEIVLYYGGNNQMSMPIKPTQVKQQLKTQTASTTRVALSLGGILLAAAFIGGGVWKAQKTASLVKTREAEKSMMQKEAAKEASKKKAGQEGESTATYGSAVRGAPAQTLVENPVECQFVAQMESGQSEYVSSRPNIFLAAGSAAGAQVPGVLEALRFVVQIPENCGEVEVVGLEVSVRGTDREGHDWLGALTSTGVDGYAIDDPEVQKETTYLRRDEAGDQVFWLALNETIAAGETRVFGVSVDATEAGSGELGNVLQVRLQNPVEFYPSGADELDHPFRAVLPNMPVPGNILTF